MCPSSEATRVMNPAEMAEFLAAQRAAILSPDNEWYAGEHLGHRPTRQEAARHFIEHGGAEQFRRRWEEQHH